MQPSVIVHDQHCKPRVSQHAWFDQFQTGIGEELPYIIGPRIPFSSDRFHCLSDGFGKDNSSFDFRFSPWISLGKRGELKVRVCLASRAGSNLSTRWRLRIHSLWISLTLKFGAPRFSPTCIILWSLSFSLSWQDDSQPSKSWKGYNDLGYAMLTEMTLLL